MTSYQIPTLDFQASDVRPAVPQWPSGGGEVALMHALRTPMTSLKGAIDLLDACVLGPLPDNLAPLIAIARRNADRLSGVIEDLLLIRDIQAGAIAYDIQALDINAVLRTAIARRPTPQRAAPCDILPADPAADMLIAGDEAWLTRALTRVLSHVHAGSSPQHRARIELHSTVHDIRLSCHGHGPTLRGMAATEGQHAADVAAGAAIGLDIARHILIAHGGTLDCRMDAASGLSVHMAFPKYGETMPACKILGRMAQRAHTEPLAEANA